MPDLALNSAEWPAEIPTLVEAALDSQREGSIVFGPDLRVLHATGRLEALLGLNRHQLTRDSDFLRAVGESAGLDSASERLLVSRLRQAVDAAETDNSPVSLFRIDGSLTINVDIRRIGRQCWIAVFEDITSQRENESNLLNRSLQDVLTGLGNRAHFSRALSSALTGGLDCAAAILLIDLDHFKEVNDNLGHPVGDSLLSLVGQRIQSVVRESDVVARLGGDEFAVLAIEDPDPTEAGALAERLIDLLHRTCLIGGHVVNVGASIGIAIAPRDGQTPDKLLQNADLALYEAKARGRNRFRFFDFSMEERSKRRRDMELDLRKALPLAQIEVYYKPLVDVTTGLLLAFDALVRWRHPVRGLLEWDSFSNLSDELGLTVQIYDWVLRAALRVAATWPSSVGVSVGVTSGQFEKRHLVTTVTTALRSASVAGSRLEIAITEEILWRNEESVLAVLRELRALGVRVGMDKFGSGYASLRQLSIFPFDRVIIDRAVLADDLGNARHRAIVRVIASLGASLGISTIVEGIETPADLARIRSEGCDEVQGYMPGKSLSESELPAMIAALKPSGAMPAKPAVI